MMEILRRMQLQKEEQEWEEEDKEESASDEEPSAVESRTPGTVLSDDTLLRLARKGEDLSLDDLLPEELRSFKRAIMTGAISSVIKPWTPWWVDVRKSEVTVGPRGTSVVCELDAAEDNRQKGDTEFQEGRSSVPTNIYEVGSIPPPPCDELPSMKQLTKVPPSPLIAIHLVNITYAYCFVMRLYNGEWSSDPPGVAAAFLDLSVVLRDASRIESMRIALQESIQTACSPTYKVAGGSVFAIAVMSDVAKLLRAGRGAVVRMLADMDRILGGRSVVTSAVIGRRQANEEGTAPETNRSTVEIRDWRGRRTSRGGRGVSTEMIVKAAEKKIYFFMVWANEQADDVFEILAESVDEEWRSQQLHQAPSNLSTSCGDGAGGSRSESFIGVEKKSEGDALDARTGQQHSHPLIEEMN